LLNFALVGCGKIAERHSYLLGNGLIENARLISVCDLDIEKADKIANQYENINSYTDIDNMMSAEKIDVVTILTPSGLHALHTKDVAKYGAHIVVEKPMALNVDDALSMINICEKQKINLFVIKQNRFNLPVVALKQAINNGRFGKLVMATIRVRWSRTQDYYNQAKWRGTWAMDGGVLANQASHHIDLLEWMMGDVESVFSLGKTALAEIETEDTAVAVLKFKNGGLGIIEATTAVRPKDLEGSISVLGEYGSVEIGGFAANELKTWNFVNSDPNDKKIMRDFSKNPNENGFSHRQYYNHITDCIINDKPNLVDGHEGLKSLVLINALYESIQTGSEIKIDLKNGFNNSKLGK